MSRAAPATALPATARTRRLRRLPAQPARGHSVERARRGEGARARSTPPRSGLLRLHNANGAPRVIGEDRDDIEVSPAEDRARRERRRPRAQLARRDPPHRRRDRRRRSSSRSRSRASGTGAAYANLELHVPRGTSIDVTVVERQDLHHRPARVRERALEQRRRSRSRTWSATSRCQSSNAKVCCACVRGRLVARSSNGKIELDEHRGSVDASTSNGLIDA